MKHKTIKGVYIFILFAALGLLIYSNTFNAPFVFDDLENILENPDIRITELTFNDIIAASLGKKTPSTRPIGNLSFALNYYFDRYNLTSYHIVNTLIHIFTGAFLFLFIRYTLRIHWYWKNNRGYEICDGRYAELNDKSDKTGLRSDFSDITSIAFFSALLWFAHPLNTQSVTYIVQRTNSMAAMFCLLALLFYVKGRAVISGQVIPSGEEGYFKGKIKSGIRLHYLYFLGSFLAWIFALGSKQTAAILPFLVFLYEYFFFQDLSRIWIKRNFQYLLIVLLLFFIVAFIFLGLNPLEKFSSLTDYSNKAFTYSERLLTQPRVILFYLSLIFFPHPSRLNLDHDFPLSHSLIHPITTVFSLFMIIAIIFLACFTARKNRLLSFSILWFLGNLVVESSIIPLALIFEHRTYLPSMLIFVPIIASLYKQVNRKTVIITSILLAILLLSVWTYQRNRVWKDDITLYSDCIKKAPGKARPYFLLGIALESKGRTDAAIENYLTAIEIRPDYSAAHNNLAIMLVKKGRLDEAIGHYHEAIRIDPDYYNAYNNLGNALSRKGLFYEAFGYYSQALKINPDYMEVYPNMGLSLEKLGRIDEAIEYYRLAIQIDPKYADAYYSLGIALLNKGDLQGAVQNLRRTLELEPDYPNLEELLKKILMAKDNI